MGRKIENENQEIGVTKKFIEKYWPVATVVAGAAGVIGASIWLTARYLRERKRKQKNEDEALEIIEKEVESGKNETAVLLETGTYLGDVSGDARQAISELASQIEDSEAKEALKTLSEVIGINQKKR